MQKRLRLGSLVVLAPLLAVAIALVTWVRTLQQQVAVLEARIATLERSQPLTVQLDVSNVGVPGDVDRAMMLDSRHPALPRELLHSMPMH